MFNGLSMYILSVYFNDRTFFLFLFLVATVVNVNHPTVSESKWFSLASTSV